MIKLTKDKWLNLNGFSNYGKSYLVMGKTYPIKDKLKDAGFKYSPLLFWHGEDNSFELPENCYYLEIDYNDFFYWDEKEGVSFLKEGAREKLENIFYPPQESVSKFVGCVGEKINALACEVKSVGGYDTAYGYRWVYNFIDKDLNEYSWHSTVNKSLSAGMTLEISGTIKEHKEYKGVQITVLTRCKLEIKDERV